MKIMAAYFRQKADLLRQLADTLISQNDQVCIQLRCLADDFDANARALEARIDRETAQISDDGSTPQIH